MIKNGRLKSPGNPRAFFAQPPNLAPALGAAISITLHSRRHWCGAGDARRSARY